MMIDGPLISVVTVVFNQKQHFQKTLDAVLSNSYAPLQYIVVDGGSNDGTLELLKENDAIIDHWVSEPDRGISHAFNKGIAAARGELIGILNAGDWYETDTLKNVAETFVSNPQVDVFCGGIRFWEGGASQLVCQSSPQDLEKETSVYHPSVFIRRSAYLKCGSYDESYDYAMDYELLLRFKRCGAKFLALPDMLANMSLDGISSKHWYRGLTEVRKARSKYFPPANVAYYHTRAVAMNVVARTLKKAGLSSVYRSYRYARDRQFMVGR